MRQTIRKAIVWYSVRSRHRKAAIIRAFIDRERVRRVLFVGIGPEIWANEGVLEHEIARSVEVVVACDPFAGRSQWPFAMADGRALPFADDSFDLVLSNAVIEHVGDETDQRAFVAEHRRVGRCWVMTTPNRWFPVESHSATVFRHWTRRGRSEQARFYTRLLSKRQFADLLPEDAEVRGLWFGPTFIACGVEARAGEPH